jgi:hypothetical protein
MMHIKYMFLGHSQSRRREVFFLHRCIVYYLSYLVLLPEGYKVFLQKEQYHYRKGNLQARFKFRLKHVDKKIGEPQKDSF